MTIKVLYAKSIQKKLTQSSKCKVQRLPHFAVPSTCKQAGTCKIQTLNETDWLPHLAVPSICKQG